MIGVCISAQKLVRAGVEERNVNARHRRILFSFYVERELDLAGTRRERIKVFGLTIDPVTCDDVRRELRRVVAIGRRRWLILRRSHARYSREQDDRRKRFQHCIAENCVRVFECLVVHFQVPFFWSKEIVCLRLRSSVNILLNRAPVTGAS